MMRNNYFHELSYYNCIVCITDQPTVPYLTVQSQTPRSTPQSPYHGRLKPLNALCGHPAKRKLIETGNFVPPSALQTNSEKWFNRSVDVMQRGSQGKKTTAEPTRKVHLSLSELCRC